MSDFDELYEKYAAVVFRYALKCAGRRDVAEDITSEVFLSLYQHLSTVDADRLPGWLFSVAKHRAIDYWRRADVEARYLRLVEAEPVSPDPPAEFRLPEAGGLKPLHRACLILRYGHGLDRAEIAARLGLTETQVKGHLQYGLSLLRKAHGVRDA